MTAKIASPIRLLLVDDHRLIRDGIKYQLGHAQDIQGVGEAANGREAVELARTCRAEVVLLDIRLAGDLDGFGTCHEMKLLEPAPRVILISGECREEDLPRAHLCRADGFVRKECEHQDLAALVRQVRAGVFALCPSLARKAFEALVAGQRRVGFELAPVEEQILELLAQGRTNKDIARLLGTSESAVAHRLTGVFRKLGAADRAEAVRIWRGPQSPGGEGRLLPPVDGMPDRVQA